MEKTIRLIASILAFCILGGAIFLTLALISPPAPLPVDAPAAAFSAGRAMQDLEIIAREPRPMGVFPAHAAARDYLLGEIRAQGIEPQVQDTFGVRFWGPASGYISGGFVENIIARLPGSGPDGAILLLAHYDSTPGGPGAADNAAGVVTILELLRALQAGPQLRQDVIFLFADGEEPGTFGAHAFVAQHTRVDEIKCVINLDTITHAPPALLRTSGGNGFWIQAWSRSGASRSAFLSLPYHLFSGSETDLFPFEKAGIPGADFAATGAFTELHTSEDRIEVVSPASLQHTGEQLLALVRYLGDQDGLEFNAADQTFFPALGQLIHYPSGWAIPLAVLASLCFLGTLIYGLRKRNLTWLGVGLSWLAFLVFLVASIGIAYLIWHGLQALHPEYAYSTVRPHLSDDALYASGFFVLALAIVIGVIIVVRKKATTLDLAAGALVIWLPGAIVTAILVPATSYLATWVLMLNSLSLLLALALQSKKNAWLWAGLAFLVSAILVTFLWLPVIFVTFLGAGFRMWWLMIGVAAIWVGALLPTWDWITSLKRWPLPVAALLAALGFLLAGHVLVGRDSPPPMVNSIGYWLDADGKEANWVAFIGGTRTDARTTSRYEVAFPAEMDERQANLLVNPIRQSYTDLFPAAPPFSVLTSQAPALALDGPHLDVLSDERVDDRRLMNIRFAASMHDRLYIVIRSTSLQAITIPFNEKIVLADNRQWWLRFDGMPVEGLEIKFEFSPGGSVQFLLVEEKTGLPSFPGLVTQPPPGAMSSPGSFLQGVPTDFTAIYRYYALPGLRDE